MEACTFFLHNFLHKIDSAFFTPTKCCPLAQSDCLLGIFSRFDIFIIALRFFRAALLELLEIAFTMPTKLKGANSKLSTCWCIQSSVNYSAILFNNALQVTIRPIHVVGQGFFTPVLTVNVTGHIINKCAGKLPEIQLKIVRFNYTSCCHLNGKG